MLHKVWEVGVARVAESQNPALNAARRALSATEDLGRRQFRRPV
jgi:hypothetical protein